MPDAGPGTEETMVVKIPMVPVLTELKIYMARQMGNKALGSIMWEFPDIKNIHFLTTWDKEKKKKARVNPGPDKKEGPHSTLRASKYNVKVLENVKRKF